MLGPASFALLVKWWVDPTTNPNDWRVWTPDDAHEYRYGQYLGAMFGRLPYGQYHSNSNYRYYGRYVAGHVR